MALRSTLVALLLGTGLAGCQPGAAPPPSPAPADAPLRRDTAVIVDTLPNGLTYYIRRNDEPRDRVELRLVVNAGSVLEDSDQRGLAHVVEHMAFNGTRHFRAHELVNYLEGVGMRFGPDVNAYTGFDETVYTLTLPTDSAGVVETGFRILEDWATGIAFDSAEVRKERGVVIEEWRLGQGADARMREQQFPVLLGDSRYAERMPIGTLPSLREFDPAALRRFYRDWYRPELMAVVAVGDLDPARMEAWIREHFAGIPPSETPRERPRFDIPPHPETRFHVATDPEATGTRVSVYLKQPARPGGTAASYRRWMTESLASAMLERRLRERTQRPDAPFLDVSSFRGRFLRPLEAYVLSASVADGGAARGLGALLAELDRAAREGFTPAELEREKAELLRSLEQRFAERDRTPSAGFAAEYVSHFLYGGALTGAETEWDLARRLIPEIGVEDANRAVREWTGEGDRVILATAPRKEGASVPTEAELIAAVRSVGEAPLAAYVDSVPDGPLMAEPPAPGRVVSERVLAEIGTREWTLANGARVILKPTDFQNDEVLLAARSPGGTSLVSDRDFVAAMTATAAVQAGGVGEWSTTELGKRLAGTVASVGAEIGDLHEGISGVASPRDLQTLFQLVHLRFTAPRLDSVAFEAYRERGRAALRNRGASPEAAWSDTLQRVLAQGHPRARPPSPALFDSLDLRRSLEIYRDRFADAGDFTFFLVGSFDPDSVRPLVERYLGSLPSTGRREQGRDVGIDPPRGIVRRTVRRGREPKARTQIVFSGPVEWGRENLYALNSLAEVLQLRLRESLREDRGGTYGVGVRASAARDPDAEYRVGIGFGSAPERLDELTEEVWAQVDSLQRFGPTPQEISKVREMQLRERETQMRENGFWIGQLMAYDRYGWDPRDILHFEQRSRSLDAAMIRDAARRFLDAENYVQVSLVPEQARGN